MLAVKIVCVGKIKEAYFQAAVAEYEKRMRPLCRFEIVEIPEARLPDAPSEAEIKTGLMREGEQLLVKAAGTLVALCMEGEAVSSEGMAGLLRDAMAYPGSVTFIIGSSYGLSGDVKERGRTISLSKMTFPHTLARVILTEQIYRGLQILQNSKYHK